MPPDPPATMPDDLAEAGAVIDQAISHMVGRNIASLSIASALLGGALGLLARTLDDAGVERVLKQAIKSVRSGDLQRPLQP